MILTVTPNPAIDLTYRVAALEPGETHRVAPPAARAGGKGLNVARVIAQTGGPAFALTTAGGASGLRLADDLEATGLPSELIPVAAPTRSSVAIVDEASGVATIFNETGAALSAAEWTALREAVERLAVPATAIVGSGSLPPGAPGGFYADLVAAARRRGIPSVIDASGTPLLAAAEAGADVVKPNRRELAETVGSDDPVAGARVLLSAGAGLVLVSLGANGMLAVSADGVRSARLPRPLSGNATGAGDAAVAALATAVAAGTTDPAVLVRRATAWSAAAVVAPLAGELDPAYPDYEARLVTS
ncbi:1-phosphofructokinase family hexose kinase [Leifsonia shinshuensis]|uniref:1-phosphofructokinase family hexose kinase n=1 Tax=Leifsonia shinshuensis TaxID=150026 RepID=A0A7G6YFB0_9MICO|nr:1-phosphofructokinase family hexose kinase [Leifsonia shinshuensis]QNE37175.1 1-phosphofructokinase family hexose kinase [Leifsonia shinshuensis]